MFQSGIMPIFSLVIYVFAVGRGFFSDVMRHPFLVILGEISFSIYMTHWVVIFSVKRYLPELSRMSQCLVIVILTFVISYLTWRFIEKPMRLSIIQAYKLLLARKTVRYSFF